ncbi:hypothetical protein CYL18_11640 [Pradoshia eiseniae]|uniref:DUF3993 domain-containing protein n=1 Tax=Pradoshia eiseniae TaxID=2064768 RepID=A0A2S7MYY0_9BACI|nr:DUF3993 domain-containing protein [Pradoshia eiseniae]PQD94979.1 hypothetical protein CYL18_11640 [Pradoshia eiseniae]
MKYLLRTFLASLAIFIVIPILNVNADRQLNEEEAFRLLQNAFKTQVALSEKPRSMEEVKESLGRYFTPEYTNDFIEMNVQENLDGEGYLAYGTDFALYYIPFFTYDENTKVGYDSDLNQWYVYEWFEESSEGPVTYNGHYEAVGLTFEDGRWAVDDYQIQFNPDELSTSADLEDEPNNKSVKEVSTEERGIWESVLGFIRYTSIKSLASLGWI